MLADTILLDKMLDLFKFILAFAIPGLTFILSTRAVAKEVIAGRAAAALRKRELDELGEESKTIINRLNKIEVRLGNVEERTGNTKALMEEIKEDIKELQADFKDLIRGNGRRG